jgi:hypothetical protein
MSTPARLIRLPPHVRPARREDARDLGDFSYRNAHVVERDGEVLAMLLGFVIPQ